MAYTGTSEPGPTKKRNSALTFVIVFMCVGPSIAAGYMTDLRCPASCTCVSIFFRGRSAYCTQRSLTEVPQSFQEDLNFICLAYNRIDEIHEHDFSKLIKMERLNLKQNVITNIHTNALGNLKELRTLDLSYNRITTLSPGLFQSNSKLESLFLGGNKLWTIGPIVHSISLKTLDIASCNIYYLPHNAFARVPNLDTLYLNDNPLSSLAIDTVETLRGLQYIRMEPKKSICLPKSFQNVTRYFQTKSVDYFPKIICELNYKCYINTERHLQEELSKHKNCNYVGRSLFIICACVFICGVGLLCILIIYNCLVQRKVASSPNVNNPTTQTLPNSSCDVKVMPWYKILLFRLSHDRKENVGIVQHGNQ
jgi:hypothetical protein